MKRDMELIRKILIEIHNKQSRKPEPLVIEGADENAVAQHVELLAEAKLIKAEHEDRLGKYLWNMHVSDMTWEGHDLFAVMSNDSVWKTLKSKFSAEQLATLPLQVLKTVGLSLLEAWAKHKSGL